MNGATIVGTIRAATVALVLIAAAALGLVFGTALNERATTTFGYPEGWAGGAAAPAAAVDAAAQSDFGIRHAVNAAAELSDYGTRHAATGADDDAAAQPERKGLAPR